MTEEEMKTKECPQHLMMMVMMQIAAGKEGASEETLTEMGKFGCCSGSKCAMWEPEYEKESMTICKDDDTPKGWHERQGGVECSRHKYNGVIGESRLVFRYFKAASGDCGLKTKESGCFYPG